MVFLCEVCLGVSACCVGYSTSCVIGEEGAGVREFVCLEYTIEVVGQV
jgi:hypothetical protein